MTSQKANPRWAVIDKRNGSYWAGGTDWAPDSDAAEIHTSKQSAKDYYRDVHGKFPQTHDAVNLDAEESVPGGVTDKTPGQTDRVKAALASATAKAEAIDAPGTEVDVAAEWFPIPDGLSDYAIQGLTPGYINQYDPKQALNFQIRCTAGDLDDAWNDLPILLDLARSMDLHTEFGLTHWSDYIADVVSNSMPNVSRDVEKRRDMVAMMSRAGMSQPAIAEALHVSQPTTSRDLKAIHDEYPDLADIKTQGRDNKTYTRPEVTPVRDEPIAEGAVVIDAEPVPKPEPKPVAPPQSTFANLMRRLESLTKMCDEAVDIATDLDFEDDASYQGQVHEGDEQYDAAQALAENLRNMAQNLLDEIEKGR